MFATNEGPHIDDLGLSDSEVALVVAVMQSGMPRNLASAKSVDAMKAQMFVRRVDMGDGEQNGLAVVIKNFCSNNGKNCMLILFHKSGSEWKLMDWVGDGPEAALFSFTGPAHSGLNDLVVNEYVTGGKFQTNVWRYNGKAYKNTGVDLVQSDSRAFGKEVPMPPELKPAGVSKFRPPDFKDQNFSHQGLPLDNVGLTKSDIAQLTVALGKTGAGEVMDLKSPETVMAEFSARHVDIGEGERNGLALQGTNELCDENGNCDLFVFRKVNNKWQIVELPINAWVGSFAFVAPDHNGLKELVVAETISKAESLNTVLQFDGTKYTTSRSYVCRYTSTNVNCQAKE
jgi:hypothetical protein